MSCATCEALLVEAVRHAAICRAPVGDRLVGPVEAAAWKRLQAASTREVAASLARSRRCPT
ncbi:MAG: hypothetical protein M0027_06595 [Candidatus Dormibacteraeota bacterium]|jgi:hypothetical protein|nr:hypothetical protein [Candidatus Dormibacteraeota bacterium]